MTRKYESNSEFISASMNHSNYGALKQSFIISALDTYSRMVIQEDIWNPMEGFVADGVWKEIAREVSKEITEQYGERS